ncbi:hypothetical protein C0991_001703 [Blastosporella zonata]|nr:hypothetical protein C0991_001703 [Blastosporella zonata]
MPTLSGFINSTSTTSIFAQFKYIFWTYKGNGTFQPEVPQFQVPDATLTLDLFFDNASIPFSGTVGPNTIDISSPEHNAHVTGALASPLDKAYYIKGYLSLNGIQHEDEAQAEAAFKDATTEAATENIDAA